MKTNSQRVGAGTYGEVFDAVQRSTGARVAVKRIDVSHVDTEYLRREVENLQKLDHPNIMKLIDRFVEGQPGQQEAYIVLERVEGTELFDKISSPKLVMQLAVNPPAGGYTPAFSDALRRAVASFIRVAPQRVNVPIAVAAGQATVRVDVYPPNDLSDKAASFETAWALKCAYLQSVQAFLKAQPFAIDASFGASLAGIALETSSALDEATARRYFRQIAEAVRYMHDTAGVCHRDLKLENVMVDPTTGTLKLIDFGFSRSVGSELKTAIGSAFYTPPEVFQAAQYDGKAVDVWTIGVMLFLMLTGNYPFQESRFGQPVIPADIALIFAGKKLSESAQNLLQGILQPNPRDRPSIQLILGHPWLSEAS
eukprot:tig00021582_g22616.t1